MIWFNGGKSTDLYIHGYTAWLSTTSPSLVSDFIIPRLDIDWLLLATTADVEWVFSHGRFLLPYTHNQLSSDSIWAHMCVDTWSVLSLVKDKDVMKGEGEDSNLESDFDIDSDDEDLGLGSESNNN